MCQECCLSINQAETRQSKLDLKDCSAPLTTNHRSQSSTSFLDNSPIIPKKQKQRTCGEQLFGSRGSGLDFSRSFSANSRSFSGLSEAPSPESPTEEIKAGSLVTTIKTKEEHRKEAQESRRCQWQQALALMQCVCASWLVSVHVCDTTDIKGIKSSRRRPSWSEPGLSSVAQ